MQHTIADLKRKLPFTEKDIDLDDIIPLSTGKTPYEEWLEDAAEQAEILINSWNLDLTAVTTSRKKRAEIQIVIALTIENLTFQDAVDAQNIQIAGMEMRTFKKLTPEERGQHITLILNRAYEILAGQKPNFYIGIE